MNPILRNILGVIVGIGVCLFLNGSLLGLLLDLVGPPVGFDPNKIDTYRLLQAEHLMAPFTAHAVGSFIGGLLAALIAATHRMNLALLVGGLHMIGGIVAAFLIPAPLWFIVLDLAAAYLPMAWLGGRAALMLRR